jgi:hypothetical protein
MKVKPANPGAVIPRPGHPTPLPAEGAEVPDNTFWRRLLIAGDVVSVDDKITGRESVTPLTTR